MADTTLTEAQITNWRRVLVGMLGPYALLMSDGEVQAFRDKLQARADACADPDADESDDESRDGEA